ncbi:MAG: sugar phosphate isomerase/epimerase [Verrucomicrobiales bacterium]|nr:sugar phosphate isomerase/epimerase [Verrucomicrobiales bacterium]
MSDVEKTAAGSSVEAALPPGRAMPLGVVVHSFWNRWQGDYSSVKLPPLRGPLDLLDTAQRMGFSAVQLEVKDWDADVARQVRQTAEGYALHLEGSLEPPMGGRRMEDVERDLRRGREAGIEVFRTYMGWRRYEQHRRWEDFEAYRRAVTEALRRVEPVARRLGVKVAVENHKDFRAEELAELLRQLSSPHLGCCLDLANNLALLEKPEETLDLLAPHLMTVHLKDMAVAATEAGFSMAEVPLGEGELDLKGLMAKCRRHAPEAGFYLEMITRDPLRIPCLEEGYWPTLRMLPGWRLASILSWVRQRGRASLPTLGERSKEQICLWEEEQILACAAVAFEQLGFTRNPTAASLEE